MPVSIIGDGRVVYKDWVYRGFLFWIGRND